MAMSVQEAFLGADAALAKVIEQIKDDQWSMKMPPEFQRRGSDEVPTLRVIINYHAFDEAWVPETLAGKTIEEVGKAHDGDLLGADPKGAYQKLAAAAAAAVRGLTDLDKKVHLSYGDWPAGEYLKHITSFRGLRAVDIARVIGVSDRLPAELVQGLWDMLSPDAEEWRKMGVYKAAVPVPEDADLQAKLLGLTGRQP